MAFKIRWASEAEEDLKTIVAYFIDEWGHSLAERFSDQVVETLRLLEKHPFSGIRTEQFSSIRRLAITKKYALYYLVLREEIVIINLLHANRKR